MNILSMYSGKNLQVFVMTAVKHALILSNKASLQCKIQHLDLKAHAKQKSLLLWPPTGHWFLSQLL